MIVLDFLLRSTESFGAEGTESIAFFSFLVFPIVCLFCTAFSFVRDETN